MPFLSLIKAPALPLTHKSRCCSRAFCSRGCWKRKHPAEKPTSQAGPSWGAPWLACCSLTLGTQNVHHTLTPTLPPSTQPPLGIRESSWSPCWGTEQAHLAPCCQEEPCLLDSLLASHCKALSLLYLLSLGGDQVTGIWSYLLL